MFSPQRSPGEASSAAVEGDSDNKPIYLSGVTELEFETLLRYFYENMHGDAPLPESRWPTLLSIAHRYEFQDVRARAIRKIYGHLREWSKQNPASDSDSESIGIIPYLKPDHVMLISMAEKYDVPLRQVFRSFVEVVMQEEPLTDVEIASLSTLTVHRLSRAREGYLRKTARDEPSNFRSVAREIVRDIWPAVKK